jgi:hypothetical protein
LAVEAVRVADIEIVTWCDTRNDLRSFTALREAPAGNIGFTETGRYYFRKPPGEWAFHVDDERLAENFEEPPCWVWEPGFFAGEVTAELCHPDGRRAALFLLDVAPDANKLGRHELATMVSELLTEDPSLVVGTEPATSPTGHLSSSEDPWLAFVRLRRYAPDFVRAIEPIRSRPRRTLRVRRESAALHQVRRIDRHTVTAILRGPGGALLATEDREQTVRPDVRLDVPSVAESMDAAANRAMLAMVRALHIRSRALLDRLRIEVERERESDTRTSLAVRWPRRRQFLESLIAQLNRIGRQLPFAAVERAEITAAGLTAIAADSTYSRAWSRGWRALRRGVDATETAERLWLSPSWEIYERWCFLRIGKLLKDRFASWNWSRRTNPHRWEGSSGERRAELRLQPTFSTCETQAPLRWSLSRERVPDIVLSVRIGEVTRFLVFDVKYRASRTSILDAMESAHIYQDSLRIGSRRPEATLLIVPRTESATWLASPTFVQAHRVGIHALQLEGSPKLPGVVSEFLD